jgi:NAD(P)-dependent dehydrogenase (short-subunit alcohol dehydrogenase family)
MPLSGRALVVGAGRGLGADIARSLASAGMDVVVSARSAGEVTSVASEIGGIAVTGDVSVPADVERMVETAGRIDLLVANAGIALWQECAWEVPLEQWWQVFEVNVLGTHLCCRAAIPGMLERGGGRIVIVASGAAYLAGLANSAYAASKAAVCRYAETLSVQLGDRLPVFAISPGLVRTKMTESFPDDSRWSSPEAVTSLVRALASGRLDALRGRYLHALDDPPDRLEKRVPEILSEDLNSIRLRR